VNYSSLCLLG